MVLVEVKSGRFTLILPLAKSCRFNTPNVKFLKLEGGGGLDDAKFTVR